MPQSTLVLLRLLLASFLLFVFVLGCAIAINPVPFIVEQTDTAAPTEPPAATEPTIYTTEPTDTPETEPPTEPQTEPPTEAPTEPPTEPEPTETEPPYTEEELEMLALVIYREAGGDKCSDETRMMVGTVVMNRIQDDRYPDTMYGVLTQRAQYGRLHWIGLVWPERASDPNEAHAVERAYAIAERILQGERSFGEDVVFQAEFRQGKEVVAYSDGMYFCR